ncbi:MAG: hypothetical protein AAGB46_08675 [Verrucomicrobiota bacterium]
MNTFLSPALLRLLVSPSAAEGTSVLLISIDDSNDWTGSLGGHPQAIAAIVGRLTAWWMEFSNAHPLFAASRQSPPSFLLPDAAGWYLSKRAMETISNGGVSG